MVDKPFDKSFVLRVTHNKIEDAIRWSIDKTLTRLHELEGDKKMEAWETLECLSKWLEMEKDFRKHNNTLFDDKDEDI